MNWTHRVSILTSIIVLFIGLCGAVCMWPSEFRSSTWRSNKHGILAFSTGTMAGASFTYDGQIISIWQCINATLSQTEGYLAMRSLTSFRMYGHYDVYAYFCLRLKPITPMSYRFYAQGLYLPELANDRLWMLVYADLSNCYTTSDEAVGSEYGVLIKTGSESSVSITCPWASLGRYDYTHTTSNGVETCSAAGDSWNLCGDKTKMSFDLVSCSTKVAYASGAVSCIDSVPGPSENYVTVYNSGTVDNSTTFQFACFAISVDMTTASVAPGYCRRSQNSSNWPIDDSNNNQIGAKLVVTNTYETCRTCPLPQAPDGGNVSVVTDGAFTTAFYACAQNYSMYGDAQRTCQDNNAWSGVETACIKCQSIGQPVGGNYQLTTNGQQTTASFQCEIGYTTTGASTANCLSNGMWSTAIPTCVPCQRLAEVDTGSGTGPILGSTGFQTRAVFRCAIGYSLVGNDFSMCQMDGSWLPDPPICVGCQFPPQTTHGSAYLSTNGSTTFATFFCELGYSLSNVTMATATCGSDGSWDVLNNTCVKCSPLDNMINGIITMTTNHSVTMAIYTCVSGHNLIGAAQMSCVNGLWTKPPPKCVKCNILGNITNGVITTTTNNSDTMAIYTCVSGHSLIGAAQMSCVNGFWTEPPPKCVCTPPRNPTNGAISVSSDGMTLTYYCNQCYTMNGSNMATCNTDGTGWSTVAPNCAELSVCTTESAESRYEKAYNGLLAVTLIVSSVLGVVVVAVVVFIGLFARRRNRKSARGTSAHTESPPQQMYNDLSTDRNPGHYDSLRMQTLGQPGRQ